MPAGSRVSRLLSRSLALTVLLPSRVVQRASAAAVDAQPRHGIRPVDVSHLNYSYTHDNQRRPHALLAIFDSLHTGRGIQRLHAAGRYSRTRPRSSRVLPSVQRSSHTPDPAICNPSTRIYSHIPWSCGVGIPRERTLHECIVAIIPSPRTTATVMLIPPDTASYAADP